jgi:hypothetical protein
MKFDYKFLIILGLTLVVYFLYREVEYIRNKLNKLENNINAIPEKITNDTQSLPLPKRPETNELPLPKRPETNELPLPKKPETQPLPKKPENKSETNTSDVPPLSTIKSSDSESEPLLIPVKTMSPGPKVIKLDIPSDEANMNNDMENIVEVFSNENETHSSEKKEETNDKKDEEPHEQDNDLDKLKLPELKKMAEDKGIALTKKVNGTNRLKTKKELIEEIVSHKK